MSETDRGPKSYELQDDLEIDGITLPAGHYMGVVGWTGVLEDGKITRSSTSHQLQLTRDQFIALGGKPLHDDRIVHINVTEHIRDGRIK